MRPRRAARGGRRGCSPAGGASDDLAPGLGDEVHVPRDAEAAGVRTHGHVDRLVRAGDHDHAALVLVAAHLARSLHEGAVRVEERVLRRETALVADAGDLRHTEAVFGEGDVAAVEESPLSQPLDVQQELGILALEGHDLTNRRRGLGVAAAGGQGGGQGGEQDSSHGMLPGCWYQRGADVLSMLGHANIKMKKRKNASQGDILSGAGRGNRTLIFRLEV